MKRLAIVVLISVCSLLAIAALPSTGGSFATTQATTAPTTLYSRTAGCRAMSIKVDTGSVVVTVSGVHDSADGLTLNAGEAATFESTAGAIRRVTVTTPSGAASGRFSVVKQ